MKCRRAATAIPTYRRTRAPDSGAGYLTQDGRPAGRGVAGADSASERRMAHNRRQREQLVRQWKQSGLTAAQFAEPLGIGPHSLHNWAWELRGGKRRKSSVREQSVRLLKVQVTPAQRGLSPQAEGRSQSSRALLELTADGRIRIDFSTDADPRTLAALVALLRGATC